MPTGSHLTLLTSSVSEVLAFCPKFGRSAEHLIISEGLPQGVNCRRKLADVAAQPNEQRQNVRQMAACVEQMLRLFQNSKSTET
jgi:hypothetical protein